MATMVTKCTVCSRNRECDYVKYQWKGFEFMILVCKDCFTAFSNQAIHDLRNVMQVIIGAEEERNEDSGAV